MLALKVPMEANTQHHDTDTKECCPEWFAHLSQTFVGIAVEVLRRSYVQTEPV
jgi:hypothetical protein